MTYQTTTPDRGAACGTCGETAARHIWGPERAMMSGAGCAAWTEGDTPSDPAGAAPATGGYAEAFARADIYRNADQADAAGEPAQAALLRRIAAEGDIYTGGFGDTDTRPDDDPEGGGGNTPPSDQGDQAQAETFGYTITDDREFNSDNPDSPRHWTNEPSDRMLAIADGYATAECATAAAGAWLSDAWNAGRRFRSADVSVEIDSSAGMSALADPATARKSARTHSAECGHCGDQSPTDTPPQADTDEMAQSADDTQGTAEGDTDLFPHIPDDRFAELDGFATTAGCERLSELLWARVGGLAGYDQADNRNRAARSGAAHIRRCGWCALEWEYRNDDGGADPAEYGRGYTDGYRGHPNDGTPGRYQAGYTDGRNGGIAAGRITDTDDTPDDDNPGGGGGGGSTPPAAGSVSADQAADEWFAERDRYVAERRTQAEGTDTPPSDQADTDTDDQGDTADDDGYCAECGGCPECVDAPVVDTGDTADDDDREYQAGYELGLTQCARPAECSDQFRAGYIDGRRVADEIDDPDYPVRERATTADLVDAAVRSALRLDDVSVALDNQADTQGTAEGDTAAECSECDYPGACDRRADECDTEGDQSADATAGWSLDDYCGTCGWRYRDHRTEPVSGRRVCNGRIDLDNPPPQGAPQGDADAAEWRRNWNAGYSAGWSARPRAGDHLERPGYETGYSSGRRREHGRPDFRTGDIPGAPADLEPPAAAQAVRNGGRE